MAYNTGTALLSRLDPQDQFAYTPETYVFVKQAAAFNLEEET